MAFPSGWRKRQPIAIQASKISSDLTDFTVLVTRQMLADAVVDPSGAAADTSQADGGDVRFASDAAGSSQLPCDVIRWGHDSTTGSGDATILVAVKIPAVSSSSETTFYIFFGTNSTESQPAAASTYGQYNAYDGNWEGFWPHGGGDTERTSGQTTGTASGTPAPTEGDTTGPVSGLLGTTFDGVDQYWNFPVGSGVYNNMVEPVTFIAWTKVADASADNGTPIGIGVDGAANERLSLGCVDSQEKHAVVAVDAGGGTGVGYSGATYADDTWSHGAAVCVSNTSRYAYTDGSQGSEQTTTVAQDPADTMHIGDKVQGSSHYWMEGACSLISLHSAARSAAWVEADYEQIHDPAAFGVAGAVANALAGPSLPPGRRRPRGRTAAGSRRLWWWLHWNTPLPSP